MSSILDALRKVEEEREAAAGNADVNLDEAVAGQELYGDVQRELKLTPSVLLIGGICFTVAVVAVSVVFAILMVNRSTATPIVATTPAVSTATPAVIESTPPAPQPEQPTPTPISTAMEPETPAIEVAVQPTPAPESAPQVTIPEPTPEPTPVATDESPAPTPPPRQETAPPAPEMTQAATIVASRPDPTPPPVRTETRQTVIPAQQSASPDPAPRAWQPPPTVEPEESDSMGDIALLPRLSPAVKSRYRLEDKKLMMPRPDSKPRQSAIIDRVEVYVGERVGGSNATLIGVDGRGVALEIMGTGERYYWRMGS